MKKALGFSFVLALFAVACNPVEEIEEEVDCNDLCTRYRDCYDTTYNVDACNDRCGELVDGGDPAAANSCDACLDSNSCAGSFECVDECYGLIP
jgi:hypothetical protein